MKPSTTATSKAGGGCLVRLAQNCEIAGGMQRHRPSRAESSDGQTTDTARGGRLSLAECIRRRRLALVH